MSNGGILERITVEGDCWVWTGATTNTGYGQVMYDKRLQVAHRVVYQILVGPCPDGLEADHLCRVKNCVNPDHIEFVTHKENVRRALKRHACKQGHRLFPWTTRANGQCIECHRIVSREYMRAKRKDN